jgi:type IV pilus assembly protein PilC
MAMAKKKSKNVTYTWEGTNKKGQPVKGEMVAASADVVKAEIRKQGYTPKKGKINDSIDHAGKNGHRSRWHTG